MADKPPGPGHAVFGLGDEPRGGVSGQPEAPQYGYSSGGGGSKTLPVLVGILLALSVANLILALATRSSFKESLSKHTDELNLLTRRMDSSDERYAQLRGQFQVTTEKLGLTQGELARARSLAVEVQKRQQAAVRELNAAIAQKAGAEEVNKLQADANTKFGNLSGDIGATRKDLEDTKAALAGTKGELTGAIAKTHDELVALAHRSDRDYFEFNLAGKRAQQKVGTVVIQLAKTDTKRNTFTVYLLADDKRILRKDKAINEPVYFYVQGAPSALEFVVNKLAKDNISGYLSSPKGFFPNVPNVLTARPGSGA
jgi:hypothetical protein